MKWIWMNDDWMAEPRFWSSVYSHGARNAPLSMGEKRMDGSYLLSELPWGVILSLVKQENSMYSYGEGKWQKMREQVRLSKSCVPAHYSGAGQMSWSWFGVNIWKTALEEAWPKSGLTDNDSVPERSRLPKCRIISTQPWLPKSHLHNSLFLKRHPSSLFWKISWEQLLKESLEYTTPFPKKLGRHEGTERN